MVIAALFVIMVTSKQPSGMTAESNTGLCPRDALPPGPETLFIKNSVLIGDNAPSIMFMEIYKIGYATELPNLIYLICMCVGV